MKKNNHKNQNGQWFIYASIFFFTLLLWVACKEPEKNSPDNIAKLSSVTTNAVVPNPYPKKPIVGELLFGSAEDAGGLGSVGDFEDTLKQHGADSRFKFGAIRSYMKVNFTAINPALVPFTPRVQGTNGRVYVPVISFRTKFPNNTHMKYSEIWNGDNDALFLQQMASIAYYYGTYANKVNGPDGLRAYPIILTFNHEFDLSDANKAYDPTITWLSEGQQFAKAFRHVHDLFTTNYPNMNAKWTWIPTAFSVRERGKADIFNFWPSRNVNPSSGLIDNGTPKLTDISYVDIMGCDAYLDPTQAGFTDAVNRGGTSASTSFLGMTKSVGPVISGVPSGIPWLVAEWGIDESCGDHNFKKNTYNNMMATLSTADYSKCILISIWPTPTERNDNRWNSPPKDALGEPCAYPWPNFVYSNGISALGFTSQISLDKHMPGGRPNTLGL